jgi:hypothetical protein
MDVRLLAALAAAFFAFSASAQTRSASGGGVPRVPQPKPAAYNPLSKSITPLNCEQYRGQVYPLNMRDYCQSIENSYIQGEAHRVGRPTPSASIVELPSLGSPEARASGLACVGGTAMRRLSNGWQQLDAADGGWQRCVER